MSIINEKLDQFQYGTISQYPYCLPVVSAVPAAGALVARVTQFAIGLFGTIVFAVGSAFSSKCIKLREKCTDHLTSGAIGAGVAVIQIIPFGAMGIRAISKLMGAAYSGG